MRTEKVADITNTKRMPEGVEDLYVRHAPAMVRLAFLLIRDAAFAEDVVQDAFVKVTGRFGHLRSMDTFDAYLRRTVVNLCLRHRRHAKVERAYLVRAGAESLRGEAGACNRRIWRRGTK